MLKECRFSFNWQALQSYVLYHIMALCPVKHRHLKRDLVPFQTRRKYEIPIVAMLQIRKLWLDKRTKLFPLETMSKSSGRSRWSAPLVNSSSHNSLIQWKLCFAQLFWMYSSINVLCPPSLPFEWRVLNKTWDLSYMWQTNPGLSWVLSEFQVKIPLLSYSIWIHSNEGNQIHSLRKAKGLLKNKKLKM